MSFEDDLSQELHERDRLLRRESQMSAEQDGRNRSAAAASAAYVANLLGQARSSLQDRGVASRRAVRAEGRAGGLILRRRYVTFTSAGYSAWPIGDGLALTDERTPDLVFAASSNAPVDFKSFLLSPLNGNARRIEPYGNPNAKNERLMLDLALFAASATVPDHVSHYIEWSNVRCGTIAGASILFDAEARAKLPLWSSSAPRASRVALAPGRVSNAAICDNSSGPHLVRPASNSDGDYFNCYSLEAMLVESVADLISTAR